MKKDPFQKELYEILNYAIKECKEELVDAKRQERWYECEEMKIRIDCYEYVKQYMKAWKHK